MNSRKTRAITGITDQGVPILEESYELRKNRTRNSNDDALKNVVLPNGKNPKLKLTWDNSRRNSFARR